MAQHWQIGELAFLAGVTVRTLHHYDAVGLLQPSLRTESGYRLYTRAELERLHLIRLYRQSGLPLESIRKILDRPDFDREAALQAHRARLQQQLAETHALLRNLDRLLESPGEDAMSERDLFDGFQPEDHTAEAEQRWGHTDAYRTSRRRAARYTPEDWRRFKAESEQLNARLVALLTAGAPADSAEARAAVEDHRRLIDRWFYPCSRAMHAQLGEMYVADPRFTETYEKLAPGLAVYVRDAILANAEADEADEAG